MKKTRIIIVTAVILAVAGAALAFILSKGGDRGETPEGPTAPTYGTEETENGEFKNVYYAESVNDAIIMVKKDGIYVSPITLENEKRVYEGNVSNQLITDGNIVYFTDRDSFEIKKLNLTDDSVKTIYKLYQKKGQDIDDYFKDGYIDGYADKYLYFEEWYDADDFTTYIYNTETGECGESEAYLGDVLSCGGYIYYFDLRFEFGYGPLYRAKSDGTEAETVAESVGTFAISENMLYYSEKISDRCIVTQKNLDTGEEHTILSMAGIDVYKITGDMLHYRDGAGADYIYRFDGEAIDNVEGLYGIFGNRVVTRLENQGSVTFTDENENTSATLDDIDYAVNYIAGNIFYISKDGDLKFKKLEA